MWEAKRVFKHTGCAILLGLPVVDKPPVFRGLVRVFHKDGSLTSFTAMSSMALPGFKMISMPLCKIIFSRLVQVAGK